MLNLNLYNQQTSILLLEFHSKDNRFISILMNNARRNQKAVMDETTIQCLLMRKGIFNRTETDPTINLAFRCQVWTEAIIYIQQVFIIFKMCHFSKGLKNKQPAISKVSLLRRKIQFSSNSFKICNHNLIKAITN
jgi:hypothetical protein